jgi:aerobic-type carbon monoxide dehydrogenase small subunit (CoxS/CutS family)
MTAKSKPFILVNGRRIELRAADKKRELLEFLREELDLTGAKRGCGIGACGCCTVLADDRPLRACITRVGDLIGKAVLTVEGLAPAPGVLHPLQQAFLDAGAVQCGFCTPGMVLTAHALLLKNPRPGRDQIRRALSANLCRCTGYQQIIEAIAAAAPAYADKETS